jgi:hypothetical protein
MITASLNSFDELDIIKEKEKKEHEKKIKQEPQLFVSASEISAPTDIP